MGADSAMKDFAPGFIATKWAPGSLGGWYSDPPQAVRWAGDLVVVGEVVRWTSPERENEGNGAFVHRVPDGTYPVYVNDGVPSGWEDEDPERYRVDTLFIPLAGPERLRTTRWSHGYDDVGQYLDGYACLRSEGARRGDEDGAIRRAKRALLSEDARTGASHGINEVVDPETGANMLSFPVCRYGEVHGFEALGEGDETLALLFLANHD
ncbi:hypothetical protein [Streptomyces marincola]|uniref:hypothetical protein n=1 Tax=Streptomyces marincola TaxID=2878388 RepID=UPI001CF1F52F|nr:hypothetical protein [Streptomyces marincola]UCM90425.1 hypothetical protein LC193_22205 [Streptomyces marincola]